jgi:serine/threonine protein kinase
VTDPEIAEAAPTSIGPYRVIRELGRGGMGIVYEGVHAQLQRRVAIKLMRGGLSSDPVQVQRFVREGRAACNIRHPHVIDVFDFGFSSGGPYLVMDYLEGHNLSEQLDAVRRIELPELLRVLFPVFSAVAAAHDVGVVHRDLKPSNIMLTHDRAGRPTPKVLDFGTSKLLADDDPALTNSAAVIGTPYYMAPEQARSSRHVDARCDQYALAVIAYECATGVRPFEAEGTYELLHAIMTAPVRPPSSLARLPADFDKVVLRALSRDPGARFANVRGFGAALLAFAPEDVRRAWSDEFAGHVEPERATDIVQATTLRDQSREHSRTRQPRSRRRLWASAGAAFALLAAWLLYSALERDPKLAITPAAPHLQAEPASRATGGPQTTTSNAASEEAPSQAPGALPPVAAEPSDRAAATKPASVAQHPSATQRTRTHKLPAASREPAARPAGSGQGVVLGDNGAPILE